MNEDDVLECPKSKILSVEEMNKRNAQLIIDEVSKESPGRKVESGDIVDDDQDHSSSQRVKTRNNDNEEQVCLLASVKTPLMSSEDGDVSMAAMSEQNDKHGKIVDSSHEIEETDSDEGKGQSQIENIQSEEQSEEWVSQVKLDKASPAEMKDVSSQQGVDLPSVNCMDRDEQSESDHFEGCVQYENNEFACEEMSDEETLPDRGTSEQFMDAGQHVSEHGSSNHNESSQDFSMNDVGVTITAIVKDTTISENSVSTKEDDGIQIVASNSLDDVAFSDRVNGLSVAASASEVTDNAYYSQESQNDSLISDDDVFHNTLCASPTRERAILDETKQNVMTLPVLEENMDTQSMTSGTCQFHSGDTHEAGNSAISLAPKDKVSQSSGKNISVEKENRSSSSDSASSISDFATLELEENLVEVDGMSSVATVHRTNDDRLPSVMDQTVLATKYDISNDGTPKSATMDQIFHIGTHQSDHDDTTASATKHHADYNVTSALATEHGTNHNDTSDSTLKLQKDHKNTAALATKHHADVDNVSSLSTKFQQDKDDASVLASKHHTDRDASSPEHQTGQNETPVTATIQPDHPDGMFKFLYKVILLLTNGICLVNFMQPYAFMC